MTSLPVLQAAPVAPSPHEMGTAERALLQLVNVAAERHREFRHWRTRLALARRFSLKRLRAQRLRLKVPLAQAPDCENCVEICCTGDDAIVSLRLTDLAKLVDAGLTRHIGKPQALVAHSKASWARREAAGSIFNAVFPALTHDQTRTCTLLSEHRTCTAYPRWPLSCRRYPYALDLQLGVIFYARGCRSTQVLPFAQATQKQRELATAVIDAYNARIDDVLLLAYCQRELSDLGLSRYLDVAAFPSACVAG